MPLSCVSVNLLKLSHDIHRNNLKMLWLIVVFLLKMLQAKTRLLLVVP